MNSIWWDFQNLFPRVNMIESRTVGGVTFNTCEKFQKGALSLSEFYCDFSRMEYGAAVISKHFQFLFHGPLSISLNPSVLDDLPSLFVFPEIRKCERLEIEGGEAMGELNMKTIFDQVKIQKKLTIRRPTPSDYVIQQAFEVEELFLRTSTWMTRDHLFRLLNCRISHLNYTRFESEDIEEFAKKWMDSRDSRIERMRIEWNSDEEFQFKGITVKEWDSRIRESEYIYEEKNTVRRVNCSRGVDLERDDGQLATVVLEETRDGIFLWFLVWNERFPEKKRLEQLPIQLAPFYRNLEKINKEWPDASSMERLLSRSDLSYLEFMDTLKIYRNIERENQEPRSIGVRCRKEIFEKMSAVINL
uniref:FBA_2 domain-containing protein n=2 Tax=Caenorhabditis tropicalis TaxID=1561998 RepID=A0A1I7TPN7_9PELO